MITAKRKRLVGIGSVVGLVFGVAVGLGVGTLTEEIPIWCGFGISVGVGMGMAWGIVCSGGSNT